MKAILAILISLNSHDMFKFIIEGKMDLSPIRYILPGIIVYPRRANGLVGNHAHLLIVPLRRSCEFDSSGKTTLIVFCLP